MEPRAAEEDAVRWKWQDECLLSSVWGGEGNSHQGEIQLPSSRGARSGFGAEACLCIPVPKHQQVPAQGAVKLPRLLQIYREKLRAEIEGRPFTAPPPSASTNASRKTASTSGAPGANKDDWGDWGDAAEQVQSQSVSAIL
jgi:hypothetical protein